MKSAFTETQKKASADWEQLIAGDVPCVMVGAATCGKSAGSLQVKEVFEREAKKRKIPCNVIEVGCIGLCYAEPIICIYKKGNPGIVYSEINPDKAAKIFDGYIAGDDLQTEYALGTVGIGKIEGIPELMEIPVFKPQVRRMLRRCGFIDPLDINHYIANGGYEGLHKALQCTPQEIIDEVKKSGLRGRGGGGFPTWRKWQFCRDAAGDRKYLICNADEGDPGAYMNRSLLEGDPHALLEGMVISGYALGADTGYIYCRAEYPLALERLRIAIKDAGDNRYLGNDIFGSRFNFKIKIKEGAGAFVCGEETALIASIEGKRGMPRTRPPFPAVSGLWGKPTIINNVESLAAVSHIMKNGAEWFAQYGTEKSKGTKTFALVGAVQNTSLVEVPMGTTIEKMIFDIGGGIKGGKKAKAVQTGGPSGGCIPVKDFSTPVDYDSLQAAGSIMGSGGIVALDETTCMVDFARYFLDFAEKESCGKCIPCRIGTRKLKDILMDICEGRGTEEDVELLENMSREVKKGALCGLGQTAPNPILTTIKYFRNEYLDHVKYKRCTAVSCKEIISSPCQHICPIDTEAASYIAYIADRQFDKAFEVILKDNPLPSVCARVCNHPCQSVCQAGKWNEPIAIRALKRFAADTAISSGTYPAKRKRTIKGDKSVAVIGAGPAGLMAGYKLVQKNYNVTIFEAFDIPGGALAVYIPEYRLPKSVLQKDINNIVNAGVKIKTGIRVGKDISFDQLRKDYDAVFIGAGTHNSRKLAIPNEDAAGVFDATDFLKSVNTGKKVTVGKHVGVIGGGNTAMDAARVALRQAECEKVTVFYRRTRNEMPALPEEIEAAIDEKIEMQFLTAPVSIAAENGLLTGLECQKIKLGTPDSSGRRRPVPIENSNFTAAIDTLLVAIGEFPDLDFLGTGSGISLSKWGTITVNEETYMTNVEGVFAGGDVVTGPDTVIRAMSAGKTAAEMIDKYLRNQKIEREYACTRPAEFVKVFEGEIEADSEYSGPAIHCHPPEKRTKDFREVEFVMTEEDAVWEARRCLRCDLQTKDAKQATGSM